MRKLQRAALAAGVTVTAAAAGLAAVGPAHASTAPPARAAQTVASSSPGGPACVRANEQVVESFFRTS
jgi:hypothetical protein